MAGTNLVLNLIATGGAQVTATIDRITNATDKASGSFASMGHLGQAASYALGQAMYSVVGQVTQLVESVVAGGFKMDASLQQSQIAFQGLSGSAGEAKKAVDDLATIAANTNYNTDEVVGWGKAWVSAGGDITHVGESMTTLTDAFAHWGLAQVDADRFMQQLTQSMMVGKMQWQDIKVMQLDGIPVMKELGKAYGVTTAQMSAMVTKGELLSRDALPKLEAQLKKDSMGAAKTQANSLAGAWANLTDKIYISIAKALTPYNDVMSNGIIKFTNWASVAIGNFAAVAVPALVKFGGAVVTWVQEAWQNAQPAVQAAMDFITGTLIPDLGKVWDFISGSLLPLMGQLYATLGQGFFDTLWAAVQWGIDNLPTLGGWLSAIGGFVGDHATDFTNLGKALGVIGVATLAWAAAQRAVDVAMAVFDALDPFTVALVAVEALVAGIVYLWLTFQSFRQAVEAIWNVIVALFVGYIKAILGAIKGLIDVLGTIASHVPGMGWLADMVKGADSAIDSVNAKLDTIQRKISVTVEVSTVQVTDSQGNSIAENANSSNQREDRSYSTSHFSKMLGLKGKNNEAKIFNFLRGQGFSAGSASGVIGNLIAESGLDPGIWQRGGGPGRGLAQWSAGGRWDQLERWTKAHGMNSTTLDGQLAFMMHELQSGGFGNLSALKHMSATDAAAYFMNHYEMPASRDPSARQRFALQVLGRHGGGTAGTINGSSSKGRGNGYGGLSGAAPFDTSTIAKDLGPHSQFFKNLLAGKSQLVDAFNNLADDVGKAGNRVANGIVSGYAKVLGRLAGTHDAMLKKLKDAQAQAAKLRQDSLTLFNQTRDNILKSGSVTASQGKDFGSIAFDMQNALNKAKQFATLVAQLRSKGLNTQSLEDIIAAGPDAGAYAQSILAQGKSGIGLINNLQAQLGKAGDSVGTTASNQMYKAAIHSADGFVQGLESQKAKLERFMAAMAYAMAKALKKALGIHSPSRVFHEIGHYTAEGLIVGMNSRRDAVMQTATDLVAVGMGSRSLRPAPARAAGAAPVVFNIHGAIDPVSTARQIKKVLAMGDVRGVNGAR